MKHMKTTDTHKAYNLALFDKSNYPVIAIGSAGTGKTYGAAKAAAQWLEKSPNHIFIGVRPNVDFAENIGALPGDEREKIAPWIRPIEQNLAAHGIHKNYLASLERSERVQFHPLGHIQGMTFDNAFILIDEAQNMTLHQLKVMLTRTGNNSKLVLCGDVAQTSHKFYNSGLAELLAMVDHFDMPVHTINFTRDDIMRSEQCRNWITAFEDWEEAKQRPDNVGAIA